jgi:hypothetical protein
MGKIILGIAVFIFFLKTFAVEKPPSEKLINPLTLVTTFPTITPTPTITLLTPPSYKVLDNKGYHVFQTFNNCGPAALSMALSFYDIDVSQKELGDALRPYQNPQGDNDDKSVTLAELAEKAAEFGLVPYHRPGGTIQRVKQFIAYDIPVITRTLLKSDDDIGHYRVVKGYDDQGQLIQDDSLQGKNLTYSYDEFDELWKPYGYEYLVLVPGDKKEIAEALLGEDVDAQSAWSRAVDGFNRKLSENPDDVFARFNLSVAYYHIGEFRKSAQAFEAVENRLSFRTLWYQIEPILSFYELEDYDRVFQITDRVLQRYNRAFSELYLLRGEIYKRRGENEFARSEFQKAVFYNKNLSEAQEALSSLPDG